MFLDPRPGRDPRFRRLDDQEVNVDALSPAFTLPPLGALSRSPTCANVGFVQPPRPQESETIGTSQNADRVPQVVFACVKNGGRSVASRVLTEQYAGDRVVALSAGTQPGEHIHPEVAAVLEKLGLDTSAEHPKLLTRETIAASDLAVTLGCGEECPYVPGVKYVDWPVADPAGQDEATVRAIIADLDARVRDMLVGLVPDLHLPPSVLDGGADQG